jgi:hypothetical protein
LHRAFESYAGNFWKLICDLLEGAIFHAVSRRGMPSGNPPATDVAITVENHQRPFTRRMLNAHFLRPSTIHALHRIGPERHTDTL